MKKRNDVKSSNGLFKRLVLKMSLLLKCEIVTKVKRYMIDIICFGAILVSFINAILYKETIFTWISYIFLHCVYFYRLIKNNMMNRLSHLESIFMIIYGLFVLLNPMMNLYRFYLEGYIILYVCLLIIPACLDIIIMLWVLYKFISRRLISVFLITFLSLILNFAQVFAYIYEPMAHRGYDVFVDKHMDTNGCGAQDLMIPSYLFLLYSSDCMLGRNYSNIEIAYIDWNNLSSIQLAHIEYADMAEVMVYIVQVISEIESFVFVIYISIFLLNLRDDKEKLSDYIESISND